MKIATVGLDLAKNVFQVHAIDEAGGVVVRKALRRRRADAAVFGGADRRRRRRAGSSLRCGRGESRSEGGGDG